MSSVLENTIITMFVMKLEGVFVLRFQLSCLIALKFNVFPLPSALEIYIVFLKPLSRAVSVCVCVCVCVLQGLLASVFVLQRLLCVFAAV